MTTLTAGAVRLVTAALPSEAAGSLACRGRAVLDLACLAAVAHVLLRFRYTEVQAAQVLGFSAVVRNMRPSHTCVTALRLKMQAVLFAEGLL